MFTANLLAALYLANHVSGSPVMDTSLPIGSLQFTKHFTLTNGHDLVLSGLARAQVFKMGRATSAVGPQAREVINEPVTNQAVSYVASVGVGSGGEKYQLIIDTGSSNTWIGANKPYIPTETSTTTDDTVKVTYGSGSFSGREFIDRVVLGPGLFIERQSIGVAEQSKGFNTDVDGILGIGPVDLTADTLSPDFIATIPTVTDNLFNDGTITANELGISFQPTDFPGNLNGVLTWGGIDRSKFIEPLTWIPLTQTLPASLYWGIDGFLQYGSSTSILSSTSGIVDTGSTLVSIAKEAFQRYKSATGAVDDAATGLLSVTSEQFDNLQSLVFTAGGMTFELTPNAQIWPRSLNEQIGGTASGIYLIIGDLGTREGEGLDFILGQAFLERFYSVYDTRNQRVGLAYTDFTSATTN